MIKGSSMSREGFRDLFLKCVKAAICAAQGDVCEDLPGEVVFLLSTGKNSRQEESLDSILAKLYGTRGFSPLIDVAVIGVKNLSTVVWVRPSDLPLTKEMGRTWDQPSGTGPFKAIGLLLPAFISEKGGPFLLADLTDGYSAVEGDWNDS